MKRKIQQSIRSVGGVRESFQGRKIFRPLSKVYRKSTIDVKTIVKFKLPQSIFDFVGIILTRHAQIHSWLLGSQKCTYDVIFVYENETKLWWFFVRNSCGARMSVCVVFRATYRNAFRIYVVAQPQSIAYICTLKMTKLRSDRW